MAGTDTDLDLVTDIRSAYEDGAEGWASGPAALYRLLAAALIATAPEQLAGRRVLDLARAFVELGGDGIKLGLAWDGEIGALGQVLAHQPVGVFVAAALPGAVGSQK